MTNGLRGIQHAWHFWYAVVFGVEVQCGGWSLRASPLNWALCLWSVTINLGVKFDELEKRLLVYCRDICLLISNICYTNIYV
ncbi:TPA: DUF3265 domain-containing protein [Vibrio parahaemolyticus]|nr:hypothetical protein CGK02_23000 [Vibrio parahaemolyticus]HCH5323558.1 DUF3265 domain-containing protein [Vibrio parahaemolyticus]